MKHLFIFLLLLIFPYQLQGQVAFESRMNNLRGRVKCVTLGDLKAEYDTLGRISYMESEAILSPSQQSSIIVVEWSEDYTQIKMGVKNPYTDEIIGSSYAYIEADQPERFVYYFGETRFSYAFDILGRVQRAVRETRVPGGFIGETELVYSYDGDIFYPSSLYDSSSQSTTQFVTLDVDDRGNPIRVKQIMPNGAENIISQSIEYYD